MEEANKVVGRDTQERPARRNRRKKNSSPIRKLSERIKERAIKILGDALRREGDDPMAEVIMRGEIWNIPRKGENRSGRPRVNWMIETGRNAWRAHKLYERLPEEVEENKRDFNYKLESHVDILIKAARDMVF